MKPEENNDIQQEQEETNQISSEPTPVPVADEDETMGGFAKIIGVFHEPSRVMESISRKPTWLLPLIILIAASAIFAFLAYDVIFDFAMDQAQQSMQKRVDAGQMSAEQVDAILEQQGKFMGIGLYVQTILGVAIMRLLGTLGLLFLGNIIFVGAKKFSHYWSLNLHASMIAALGTIIGAFLVRSSGDLANASIGLGFLAGNDVSSPLFKILSAFNVFTIWEAIVIGIGLAVMGQFSKTKGIITMVLIYIAIGVGTSFLAGHSFV